MNRRNIKRTEIQPARYGMTGRGFTVGELRDDAWQWYNLSGGPIDAPSLIARGSLHQSFVQRDRKGNPGYVYVGACVPRFGD
jgi:hypothetical protein